MQTGKLSAASGRFSRTSSVARGGAKKPGDDVESDTVTNETVDATGRRPVWLLLLTLCLSNAGEAVEVMKGGFMLPRATDDAAGMTMISTGIFVGMFIGGFVSGAVADTLGRVFAMKWALILACLAGLGQAAAPNIMALVVCRVLSGTGVGAATPPLFALATEYAPPGKSGPAISLVASFWMVGSIFAAWIALIMIGEPEHDWPTWPSDLSGLEGARRLSGGGGGAAAAASYTLPADWVPDPEWDAPWRKYALACASVPIFATVLVICALPTDGTGVDAEDAEPPQSFGGLCSDLMKNHGSSLFLLCVVWFGLNFGSYGLSSWITVLLNAVGVDDAYFVSLLYAFAMLPGNLISIFGIDIIGRKLLLMLTMGLSALSAIALGMVDSSNKSMVILAACTFSGASNGGWNALEVISTESFPTEVRAFSFSILAASGRIASMIAQIVNGALMSSPLKLLSVTATFMTVGCGAALFLKPGAYAH